MSELESLIQQKKALEKKIKELKRQSVQFGLAKVDVEHYPTLNPDRHFLAVYYKPLNNGHEKWQTIYSAKSKQEVIDAIPVIISNLQNLYTVLTQIKDGE